MLYYALEILLCASKLAYTPFGVLYWMGGTASTSPKLVDIVHCGNADHSVSASPGCNFRDPIDL